MTDFIRKKLQVFVSSTYLDLKEERQAAVEAILAAGHIPAGMELFTAGDESQMEVIKQWIDESDVYLLILGARYGSVESSSGKSYTHIEYEYALSKSKPLFACVLKESMTEPRVKSRGLDVLEREHPQKYKEFRDQVLSKMSKFWEDSKDIKITVTETLSQLTRREELSGWIRSSTQSNLPAIADEIARLSKENALLRDQLAQTTRDEPISGITFVQLRELLKEKGVLEFFTKNAAALSSPRGFQAETHGDKVLLRELSMRGLVLFKASVGGFHDYAITESGRIFMNKFETALLVERKLPRETGAA